MWSEHLIGTPLGVIKARAATALPDGHRCEANAIDDMQGTPWQLSAMHRGTNIRAQKTDEEDQGDEEEEDRRNPDGNIRRRRPRSDSRRHG